HASSRIQHISHALLSFFCWCLPPPPRSTLFPYTTLFRSQGEWPVGNSCFFGDSARYTAAQQIASVKGCPNGGIVVTHLNNSVYQDRKSTRLNSSHSQISYAVFCLKKKNQKLNTHKHITPE